MKLRHAVVLFSATLLSLAVSLPASEGLSVLRFDNPTLDGGLLDYNGTGGPAIGTDIIFQNVIGEGTPLNSGVTLTCDTECLLNFGTGPNISDTGGVYQFAGGGIFFLEGTLLDPALNPVASGILLTGTFANPVGMVGLEGPGPQGGQLTLTGVGFDTKNQDLLDFYGITNPNFIYANSDIRATGFFGPNGSFSGDVTEADITNTEVVQVPLAGTLTLLGLGLAALAGRKLFAS